MTKDRLIYVAIGLLAGSVAFAQPPDPAAEAAYLAAFKTFSTARDATVALSTSFTAEIVIHDKDSKDKTPKLVRAHYDGKQVVAESDDFVYVSTLYRSFLLGRRGKSDPLIILEYTPISTEPRSMNEVYQFEGNLNYPMDTACRPYGLYQKFLSVDSAYPNKTRHIVRQTTLTNGLIRFDFSDSPSVGRADEGYCVVDPQTEYNAIEIQIESRDTKSLSWSNERWAYYEPTLEIPHNLVKNFRTKQSIAIGKRPKVEHDIEITFSDYRVGPIPPEKLTFEYYGLPDPLGSHRSPRLYIAIAVGVVAFIGFYLLRRRRRAKEAGL